MKIFWRDRMNLTVIIEDKAIYIDGFVVQPADMSWFNPDDYDRKVNAIQWEETWGEIEYAEGSPTPIDNIDFLKDVIDIHQKSKEEWEEQQEEFKKASELHDLLEYDPEDVKKLDFQSWDLGDDIDEEKLDAILNEIDVDIVGDVPLIYAEEQDISQESAEDILGMGNADVPDPVTKTEENDIMHEDLRDALDNQDDSSYVMEEDVENQIYYDIEELLKEI